MPRASTRWSTARTWLGLDHDRLRRRRAAPCRAPGAEKLGVKRLIVPADPGVGSAVGFLSAPMAYELVRSNYQRLSAFDRGGIDKLFETLSVQCRAIVGVAAPGQALVERRSALMRYCGQGHEIEIAVAPGRVMEETAGQLRAAYEARYVELFGRGLPSNDIEVLTWNLVVSAPVPAAAAMAPPSATFSAQPGARSRGSSTRRRAGTGICRATGVPISRRGRSWPGRP